MDELCGFSDHHHHYSSSASSSSMAMLQQQQEQQFPLPAAEYYSFEPLSAVVPGSDPAVYYYSGSNSFTDCVSVAAVAVARGGNQPSGGAGAGGGEALCSAVNAKIASHPLYPNLVQAYIDCQKVGAPPQIADILEEIRRESDELSKRSVVGGSTYCMGVDPELDEFMETYCQILIKYKSDLTKPFDEAITFLNSMETQLNNLANNSNVAPDPVAVNSSDDEEYLSGGEIDGKESDHQRANVDNELKGKLLRKYSGYISTLKNEFSKKKKKGKLPKDAKQILTNWWNVHYKWPYPTEVDKMTLAQVTGLDQKQINNWFINQRKRHWKPSENMQFAVMESLYGPRD